MLAWERRKGDETGIFCGSQKLAKRKNGTQKETTK